MSSKSLQGIKDFLKSFSVSASDGTVSFEYELLFVQILYSLY